VRIGLPAGKHQLGAAFGFVPEGLLAEASSGASFRVSVRDETGRESTLFERFLDPLRVADDAGFQRLGVEFETDAASELCLAIDPGSDAHGDWTCWSDVALVER
jgi:hypothetical protein